jgi:hypothetical protein
MPPHIMRQQLITITAPHTSMTRADTRKPANTHRPRNSTASKHTGTRPKPTSIPANKWFEKYQPASVSWAGFFSLQPLFHLTYGLASATDVDGLSHAS